MAQSISQEAIGATGLPGATAASRYAGATASGAPTTGTFAVGDYVVDQTGKMYVCTVAGTPGTWTQVGTATTSVTMGGDVTGNSATSTVAKINGTALGTLSGATSGQVLAWNGSAWAPATSSGGAPGTTVSSFISSSISLLASGSEMNLTSISITAGTWLISFVVTYTSPGSTNQQIDFAVSTTSASFTGNIFGVTGYNPTASGYGTSTSSTYSYTTASSATLYLVSKATSSGFMAVASYNGTGGHTTTINVTGITAVRTA